MMNISQMTLEALQAIETPTVEFGRTFAEQLQDERARILKLMVGQDGKQAWQALADRRYDLHRLRIQTLLDISHMVARRKKIAGGK